MANKLATVTGNFTTAGTWVVPNTGTNADLRATGTSTTALTTANLDSATFTPAAQASQYLTIRVGTRNAGSPTNKLTVILRNNTTATDIWTFVMNVSDIPSVTSTAVTGDECGFITFKAAASLTPNGTDTYLVRCKLDSTSTPVALCTNGTANNWQRVLWQTATGAPAAGEDMWIGGVWNTSNPATKTDVVVTMDNTATTDFGSASTSGRQAALNIMKGGTLSYGTGSSAYYMRLSGWLVVFSGGSFLGGTYGGTSVPTTGSGVLELDPTVANGDFQIDIKNGGTFNTSGSPRTAGKAVSQTLLTANLAASGTSLTVQDDTGWKDTDLIGISVVNQTPSQMEEKILNGNAGASSMSITVGVTNARTVDATNQFYAEVVLRTRNFEIRTTGSFNYYIQLRAGGTLACEWTRFLNGGSLGTAYINSPGATGSLTMKHCIIDTGNRPLDIGSTTPWTGTLNIQNLTVWKSGTANNQHSLITYDETAGSDATFSNCWILSTSTSNQLLSWFGANANLDGLRICGGFYCLWFNGLLARTYSNWSLHGASTNGLLFNSGDVANVTFSNCNFWRTNRGIAANGSANGTFIVSNVTFSGCRVVGNTSAGIVFTAAGTQVSDVRFLDCVLSGDSSFAQPYGITFHNATNLYFYNTTFGVASGINVAHSTADMDFGASGIGQTGVGYPRQVTMVNCNMASSTELSGLTTRFNPVSYLARQNNDATAGQNSVKTLYGDVSYETSTVDVSPSIKMTPSSATNKLDTSANIKECGFYVPVDNGNTPTISVKVQKDGSYNGNAPRLILRRNDAVGVSADTVIATFSGSSGSWVTVSGTCPAAVGAGVYEFVVDCDGTAGSVYVDTFVSTGAGAVALSGLAYWFNGLAC